MHISHHASILLLTALIAAESSSQPPDLQWCNIYSDSMSSCAYDIVEISEGGYAFAGYKDAPTDDEPDFWLGKLATDGSLEWEVTFGGEGSDVASYIFQTDDGGFMLGGVTQSYFAGEPRILLVKTDASGNSEWSEVYGSDTINSWGIDHTLDGGYILGYESDSMNDYESWIRLMKTDSNGNIEWECCLNPDTSAAGGLHVTDVLETSDGNFLVTADQGAHYSWDSWIIKVNSEGTILWQERIDYTGSNCSFSCEEVAVGFGAGYVCLGVSWDIGSETSEQMDILGYWFIKLDLYGNLLWESSFPDVNFIPKAFCQDQEGCFLFTGFGSQYNSIPMFKKTSGGTHEWAEYYSTSGQDTGGASIIQNTSGSFVVAGGTGWDFYGPHDALVMTTESVTGMTQSSGDTGFDLLPFYPNPASTTAIRFFLPEPSFSAFSVFDMHGRLVHEIASSGYQEGYGSVPVPDLISGVYFCRMTSEDFTATQRFVVIK